MRVRNIGPVETQEVDGSWRLLTADDLRGETGATGSVGPPGVSFHSTVRAASAGGNVSLAAAGSRTLDTVSLSPGDRVLLKDQTLPAQNGIYTVAGDFSLARSTDADTGAELVAAAVGVLSGASYALTAWTLATPGPITVGTTALTWVPLGRIGRSERYNVLDYGAKGDAQAAWSNDGSYGGSITSGSAVVHLVGGGFTADPSYYVGKKCVLDNAGASGAPLVGTITAINGAGDQLTLNVTAGATVTAESVVFGTDDRAAFQAAAAAAAAGRGGIVFVPNGLDGVTWSNGAPSRRNYLIGTDNQALDVTNSNNLTLEGAGGAASVAWPCIMYAGGVGPGIKYGSSSGFTMRHLKVQYTCAITENLIEGGWGSSSSDPQHCKFDSCTIGNFFTGPNTCDALLTLGEALFTSVENCAMFGGDFCIRGGPNYSNAIQIGPTNSFNFYRTAAIQNANQAWTIVGNGVEPGGASGHVKLLENANSPGNGPGGCLIQGNWLGDAAVESAAITFGTDAVSGVTIIGNFFGSLGENQPYISFAGNAFGVVIVGNQFGTALAAHIKFSGSQAAGLLIAGNRYDGTPTHGVVWNATGNPLSGVIDDTQMLGHDSAMALYGGAKNSIPAGVTGGAGVWLMDLNQGSIPTGLPGGGVVKLGAGAAVPQPTVFMGRSTSGGEAWLAAGSSPTAAVRVSDAKVGFHGTDPQAKGTVTGSRGGNAALASLLTILANKGLLTDSSS